MGYFYKFKLEYINLFCAQEKKNMFGYCVYDGLITKIPWSHMEDILSVCITIVFDKI